MNYTSRSMLGRKFLKVIGTSLRELFEVFKNYCSFVMNSIIVLFIFVNYFYAFHCLVKILTVVFVLVSFVRLAMREFLFIKWKFIMCLN